MYNQQGYPQQQQGYPQQQPMMPQQQMMMPMQQPMMMPQPVVMVQGNPLNFMNALDKLANVPGIFVKQKFELMEAITGCETENKYVVYAADNDGDQKKKIPMFKAKEKSDFCARQCLNGECRPFKVKIEHEAHGASSNEGEPCLKLNRECSCTFLCCNRPEMTVHWTEQGNDQYLGKIVAPFMCCNLGLDIYNANGEKRWKIEGSCCQLGLWCKCPCEPCQTIDFVIFDNSGQQEGTLQKRSRGCLKSAISDADSFALVYPKHATKEERAVLMAAVIFLDFRYFEENPNQNRQQSY